MPLTIEPVDVYADPAVEEFHAVEVAAATRPYATPHTMHELTVRMRRPQAYRDSRWYVGRDERGRAVGYGTVEMTLVDNTQLAEVDVAVLPEHRRHGYGAAILGHVCDVVRQAGRTSVLCAVRWGMDEDGGPGRRLLERVGLTMREVEIQRVLDLPVDTGRLERIQRDVAARHREYELVGWHGPCPDEWIDQYAVLLGLIIAEAPSGDLEIEVETYDADRVRDDEQELAAQHRVAFTSVAIAPDGTLAGHTQLIVPAGDPVNAFQWDTLVLPGHRGHRLGLALKAANHLAAADALAPRSLVHTWNSASNGPMIAVNAALGYRPVQQVGVFQGPVPAG
jgi:GNAT superfamily N-acetyltransferase